MPASGRFWPALWLVVAATAADPLTLFRPSAARSEYGVVSEVEFSTPLIELEPGSLAHHLPHAMKDYHLGPVTRTPPLFFRRSLDWKRLCLTMGKGTRMEDCFQ